MPEIAEIDYLVEQNDLHGVHSLNLVLVAVGQQSQKAGSLDGRVELALVDGPRTGEPRRNDLAILGNEITQGINILVIDFLNPSDGEAAKALALEQQGLGVALGALVLVEFFKCGHDGLLEN